jgi:hypothetical protein
MSIDISPTSITAMVGKISWPPCETAQIGASGKSASGFGISVLPGPPTVGSNAANTIRTASKASARRTSRPHCPVGSSPLGNTTVRRKNRAKPALPIHAPSHTCASSQAPADPVWSNSKGTPVGATTRTKNQPSPTRIQPITFLGRRTARKVPTPAYAMKKGTTPNKGAVELRIPSHKPTTNPIARSTRRLSPATRSS